MAKQLQALIGITCVVVLLYIGHIEYEKFALARALQRLIEPAPQEVSDGRFSAEWSLWSKQYDGQYHCRNTYSKHRYIVKRGRPIDPNYSAGWECKTR